MPKRQAAEMTTQTITDEEYTRFFRASPYSVEKEQQVAVAPIPSQGSPISFGNSGDLETDNDGLNPSLFSAEFGQILHAVDDFQWDIAGSQVQEFSSAAVGPGSTQYDTSGQQDIPPQAQVSHCSSGSTDQVCPPATTNGLQVLPTTTAPSSSFLPPPPAAGIDPEILAGALQAAITAPGPCVAVPAVPGPSAPTWPNNNTTTTTPFAPPPPQTFFLTTPQPINSINLLPTTAPKPTPATANMVVPYRPQSPPPELLSDYPHLHRTHHTTGYRDGLTQARNQTSQPAFDAGFPIGMHYGYRVGRILGLLEFALAGTTQGLGYEIMTRASAELEVVIK